MNRPVRKIRHWRQRFDPKVQLRFRKTITWSRELVFWPGDEVPEDLMPPNKLRRWWEAGILELAEFDEKDHAHSSKPKITKVAEEDKVPNNSEAGKEVATTEGIEVVCKLKAGSALPEIITDPVTTSQYAEDTPDSPVEATTLEDTPATIITPTAAPKTKVKPKTKPKSKVKTEVTPKATKAANAAPWE